MLRYDLDKLGWYEFKRLCQSLLKHKLGLGIEAWGGTNDWGRDAYYEDYLNYPTKKTQKGPFLFQCKFVNGANSAGADVEKPVLNAIEKECTSIKKKISSGKWTNVPSVYTFLTNAILTGKIRTKIKDIIKATLPSTKIIIKDGKDVCGLIDLTSGIARRFPQILSLNDLNILLSECVNRDILNRSDAAVQEAKEISKVFVPTEAYSRALSVLQKHHYVVLEGPPEVGKTAIGRMMALSYIPEEWEAVECQSPNDFLRSHNPERKQIFIADDSFGRTEYNPERVAHWQNELPAILRKINREHLLIMTSRKHLLEMAKEEIDIPGENREFPLPAEVLVDVSKLTVMEKTLMLYKHMKQASLTEEQKKTVCGLAKSIITHKGFTPERIRELTQEAKQKKISSSLIEDTLQNPTARMSKTYRKLSSAHKWFMISILINNNEGYINTIENTKIIYDKICPLEDMVIPFERIVSHLSEAFIKISVYAYSNGQIAQKLINWVHPSCGDMVSKDLSDNPKDRMHFLAKCNLSGLKYAASVGGGAKGLIMLPLLKSYSDWAQFKTRCDKEWDITLLNHMSKSIQQLSKNQQYHKEGELLKNIFIGILENAITQINSGSGTVDLLIAILVNLKRYPDIKVPVIEYRKVWFDYADSAIEIIEGDYSGWHKWSDIERFVSLSKAIMNYDRNCFEDNDICIKWRNFIEILLKQGEEESSTYVCNPDATLASELYESYEKNRDIFENISTMMTNEEDNVQCMNISKNFEGLMEDISEYIPQEREYEQDDDMSFSHLDERYSVEDIFKDL